ncbi:hypothetical protein M3J07_012305 [Ascochyta lentis]
MSVQSRPQRLHGSVAQRSWVKTYVLRPQIRRVHGEPGSSLTKRAYISYYNLRCSDGDALGSGLPLR